MDSKAPDLVDDYALVLGSSMPTSTQILVYIRDMLKIHDACKVLEDNPLKLYVAFLYMEKDYADRNVHNYAETIHFMNPLMYQNDQKQPYITENGSILDRLRCPSCSIRLKPKQAYEVHMLRQSVPCKNCPCIITFESMCIATFVKDYKRGRYERLRKCKARFHYGNENNTWRKFIAYVNEVLKHEIKRVEKDNAARQELCKEWADSLKKIIKLAQFNISKFSIDLVPGMYRHLTFIDKVCNNIDYWCDNDVLEESIKRYNKFMILMRNHADKTFVPTLDIDLVWKAHQAQPWTYIRYSYTIHRSVVQQDEFLEGNDREVAYAKTFIHWSKYYKEPYSTTPPSFWTWMNGHYRSSLAFPPLLAYRYIQFLNHSKCLPSTPKYAATISSSKVADSKLSLQQTNNDDGFGMNATDIAVLNDMDFLESSSDVSNISKRSRSESVDSQNTVESDAVNALLGKKDARSETRSETSDEWAEQLVILPSLNSFGTAAPKSVNNRPVFSDSGNIKSPINSTRSSTFSQSDMSLGSLTSVKSNEAMETAEQVVPLTSSPSLKGKASDGIDSWRLKPGFTGSPSINESKGGRKPAVGSPSLSQRKMGDSFRSSIGSKNRSSISAPNKTKNKVSFFGFDDEDSKTSPVDISGNNVHRSNAIGLTDDALNSLPSSIISKLPAAVDESSLLSTESEFNSAFN